MKLRQECHLLYGIVLCYLLSETGERAPPVLDLHTMGEMKGWLV